MPSASPGDLEGGVAAGAQPALRRPKPVAAMSGFDRCHQGGGDLDGRGGGESGQGMTLDLERCGRSNEPLFAAR